MVDEYRGAISNIELSGDGTTYLICFVCSRTLYVLKASGDIAKIMSYLFHNNIERPVILDVNRETGEILEVKDIPI